MIIEATNVSNATQTQLSKGSEQVREGRKKAEDLVQSEQVEKQQVQPEELLNQIKALTEEGLYSVRFENDERANGLVVQIIDRTNNEVISQFPAEEILDLRVALEDLRGNIVSTEG